jgi:hypothetical protein
MALRLGHQPDAAALEPLAPQHFGTARTPQRLHCSLDGGGLGSGMAVAPAIRSGRSRR